MSERNSSIPVPVPAAQDGGRPLRVVHLGNVPVPKGHPQYVHCRGQHCGRWVLNHALAQAAAGMDVEVVTLAHRAKCDFTCEIEGVRVHFLRTYHPYRHFTFYLLDSIRLARKVRELKPDIVHAHGTESAYGWAAQRARLPYCITAQGLFFQIIPTLDRPPTLNERFLRWGEHLVLRRAKHVVAKSEYVRQALAAEYPRLQLSLIPNTYEPALDTPALSPKAPRSLVFVGTTDERKGVHLIAEAMKQVVREFPDVTLHLVGNPSEKRATGYAGEQLRSLRATLGNRLVLHGRVPSKTLFGILDGCEALLAPSLEEMFGNQLIEALMRGCHGIVTENTALAENARRFGNATVVPQKDPAALAEAVLRVFREPPTPERRESARAAIRAYMSPPAVAVAHKALYGDILSNCGGRAK